MPDGRQNPNLDLATGVIHVRRGGTSRRAAVSTKNRKPRKVPVFAVLRDYLDEALLSCEDDEHIFGRPQHVARAGERARERWEERKLLVLCLHDCRHTFASYAIAAGLNFKTVSTCLGHATIAITLDLYGHLLPGSEDDAAELFDAYVARSIGGTAAHTATQPELLAV